MNKLYALALILGMAGCKTAPSPPVGTKDTGWVKAGHKFYVGRKISNFPDLHEETWLKPDATSCGSIYEYNGTWIAYAAEDGSKEHYLKTKQEAYSWISDWCEEKR